MCPCDSASRTMQETLETQASCAEDATLPSLTLMTGLPTCVAVMTSLYCINRKFSSDYLEVVSLCLCADDIPLQRLVTPPIIIPYGPFWDEIEGWWGDLVNEVGEIPFGANEYFVEHIKPSLSEHCMFVQCTCQEKLALCMEYVQMVTHHDCIHRTQCSAGYCFACNSQARHSSHQR